LIGPILLVVVLSKVEMTFQKEGEKKTKSCLLDVNLQFISVE